MHRVEREIFYDGPGELVERENKYENDYYILLYYVKILQKINKFMVVITWIHTFVFILFLIFITFIGFVSLYK